MYYILNNNGKSINFADGIVSGTMILLIHANYFNL